MSFFGSNTKKYYSSTSTKLYADVKGIIPQTISGAVLQNRNLTTDLRDNLVNGTYASATRLYNFGKSGRYPYGLPSGSATTLAPSQPKNVQLIIEKEIGKPIHLASCLITLNTSSEMIYDARYNLLSNVGEVLPEEYIWTYNETSGAYPLLDLELVDIQEVSPYYPIIPLRIDNQNQVAEGMPHRQEIKQAARYLRVDAVDINKGIEKQLEEDDNNPPEDCFIVLGVEVADSNENAKEYLYRFFAHQYGLAKVTMEDYLYWETAPGNEPPPYNSIVIQDSTYKMSLEWLYITRSIHSGTIGKQNKYYTEFTQGINCYVGDGIYFSRDTLTLRHQLRDNQYEELVVFGLVHSNWAIGKELRSTLKDAFDDPDGIGACFIIPLRRDLTKNMGAVKQHDLMVASVRMVVNDLFKQKLKWYQTKFFQVVMLIVAMVITIYNPPLGIAAGSAAAVGFAIAQVVIMKILAPVIVKAIADVVGEELAIIISAIAAYYTGGQGIAALVGSVSQAVGGLSTLHYQDQLADIYAEIESVKEQTAELLEKELATDIQITEAVNRTRSDTYAIMQADTYIRRFFLDYKMENYITEANTHFTEVAKFIDKPDSYIRLGHS